MNDASNIVLVEFSKYCPGCKHWSDASFLNPDIGEYDGEKWSGLATKEEYYPCCDCLEVAAREGTEVPIFYEVEK